MKTIIAIFLVGFLGFLGCSDSNDGTATFTGEAIPVAPFGIIETPAPIYEWTPVPWATRYRLVVQDTNPAATIQDTNETTVIDEWYTAEEAGCASEDGLCMATPDIEVFEENTWKVQACNNKELCGQWSESISFDVSPSNLSARFIVHQDEIVWDRNTGLIWTKNANLYGLQWYKIAKQACYEYGGYPHYWRLPSMRELRSLLDITSIELGVPKLPERHPFINVPPFWFSHWTHTKCVVDLALFDYHGFYTVNFWTTLSICAPDHEDEESWWLPRYTGYVWCVSDRCNLWGPENCDWESFSDCFSCHRQG